MSIDIIYFVRFHARPEDLDAFITDLATGEGSTDTLSSTTTSTRRIVDTRTLLRRLLKLRGPWPGYQGELCQKIRRLLRVNFPLRYFKYIGV